ncbi:hypothetical protein AGOR_G00228890 [Albula goreensis]|uniref:Battenin n=1 Tax=Albula goreensis TaxID=1534307 RepID=A0A8T3CQ65_9TELE|nr:hypothetical protein AGOR_G00228890 [Albula goreensis]
MDPTVSVNGDQDPMVASNLQAGPGRFYFLRNISGFWLLGLCNNFAYVVMLSAAHDILKQQETHNTTSPTPTTWLHQQDGRNSSNSSRYDCNPVSTAAVLLADILPTLIIKVTAPFFIHKCPYGFRVLLCVAAAAVSFLVVSFSSAVWMSLLGVIFASISAGLGELSFLSLTVFFNRSVVGGWGSGTGGAGVAGALLYSAFTQAGLSPRVTLLVMLVVPAFMAISYFFLLEFPHLSRSGEETRPLLREDPDEAEGKKREERGHTGELNCREKINILKGLLKFVIPLAVVYFAEYFINQGLLELLFFPGFYLSHAEQYRWYQTTYQFGVFFSRSSLFCVKIRKVWILSALQCVNAGLLFAAVYYQFLPSAAIVFAIIAYEGLLGGAAYVNTFHFISKETGKREREFAMASASMGDSFGIALSGLAAIPLHNYFCSL